VSEIPKLHGQKVRTSFRSRDELVSSRDGDREIGHSLKSVSTQTKSPGINTPIALSNRNNSTAPKQFTKGHEVKISIQFKPDGFDSEEKSIEARIEEPIRQDSIVAVRIGRIGPVFL
jgi:hypothetical protein